MTRRHLLISVTIAAGTLAGCSIASADDGRRWMNIARDSGYVVSIDTARVVSGYGHVYSVWYRTDHTRIVSYRGKSFNREVVNGLLDCGRMRFKVVSDAMSIGAGTAVARQEEGPGDLGRQAWRPVERESMDGAVARAACAVAPRVAKRR